MSQELTQNTIYELAKTFQNEGGSGKTKLSDIDDKETKDMLIWYLKIDQGNTITDIAVLLKCERKTVSESIKRGQRQRAAQLEKEGVNAYTEFIRFKHSIELVQQRALSAGELAVYLSSLKLYRDELRKTGLIPQGPAELSVTVNQNIVNMDALTDEQRRELCELAKAHRRNLSRANQQPGGTEIDRISGEVEALPAESKFN